MRRADRQVDGLWIAGSLDVEDDWTSFPKALDPSMASPKSWTMALNRLHSMLAALAS